MSAVSAMKLFDSLPKDIQGVISKYCDKENIEYYELIEYAYFNKLPIYSFDVLKIICYEHKKKIFLEYYTELIINISSRENYGCGIYSCSYLFSYIIENFKYNYDVSQHELMSLINKYKNLFCGTCINFNYKTLSCDCGLLNKVFYIKNMNDGFQTEKSIKNYNVKNTVNLIFNCSFNLISECEKLGIKTNKEKLLCSSYRKNINI